VGRQRSGHAGISLRRDRSPHPALRDWVRTEKLRRLGAVVTRGGLRLLRRRQDLQTMEVERKGLQGRRCSKQFHGFRSLSSWITPGQHSVRCSLLSTHERLREDLLAAPEELGAQTARVTAIRVAWYFPSRRQNPQSSEQRVRARSVKSKTAPSMVRGVDQRPTFHRGIHGDEQPHEFWKQRRETSLAPLELGLIRHGLARHTDDEC
jgi:hypothetical protein